MNYAEFINSEFKNSGMRDYGTYFDMLQCIAVNAGQIITPTIISKKFKQVFDREVNLSHNTAIKYFERIKAAGLIVEIKRYYIREYRPPIKNSNYYLRDPGLFDFLVSSSQSNFLFHSKNKDYPIDEYLIARGKTIMLSELLNKGYLEEDIFSGRIDYFVNTVAERKRVKVCIDFICAKATGIRGVIFVTRELKNSLDGDKKAFNEYVRALCLHAKELPIIFVDVFEKSCEFMAEGFLFVDLNKAIEELLK